MKFENFIKESSYEEQLFKMVSAIHKNCQPFITKALLPQLPKIVTFLFRGSSYDGEFKERDVRTDREPSDIHPIIHNDINSRIQKKFGWPARSAGLFTTGDVTSAYDYGEPYVIMPIGNFKYLWSPVIEDLYDYINKDLSIRHVAGNYSNPKDINPLINNYFSSHSKYSSDPQASYEKYLDKLVSTYTDKDIIKGILSKNEVMIGCSSYYKVSLKYRSEILRWFMDHKNNKPTKKLFNDSMVIS